jgi:hypothetical protein
MTIGLKSPLGKMFETLFGLPELLWDSSEFDTTSKSL